jgi:hypothetical protein
VIQCVDLRGVIFPCRDHQDRELSEVAKAPADFGAIDIRQTEIEQNQSRRTRQDSLDGSLAGRGLRDRVIAAFQDRPERAASQRVVVDDEYE